MSVRRFAYGSHDCGLFVANWITRVTDRDPAAEWRGRYHDEDSLAALCPGGWPYRFDNMMQEARMVRTAEPQLGDVALVRGADHLPHATIRTAAGFVTAAESGLGGMRDVRVIRAWSFP